MSAQSAPLRLLAVALSVVVLAACENPLKKQEEDASKNTFACLYDGERLVVRFADGEARMLMPDARRVTLYQVPVASGVRYSNGVIELRGKGAELQIVREGVATQLKDCEPYVAPSGAR
jgi:membrane-bound inhibitor of C-type lysozyme